MAYADLYDDSGISWGEPVGQFDPVEVQQAAQQSAGGYPGPAPDAPQAPAGPPKKTKSGNVRNDWFSLIEGLAPTAQSIADVFPTFMEWYPGSSYEKGDIKGPWGWADVIGNMDSGNGHWQWYQGSGGAGKAKNPYTGIFNDPLTKQYQQLLQAQIGMYQQQQKQYTEEAARKQAARTATEAETKRLMAYLNERIGRLGQPAYTDSEAEVFRTRALDPIERDRAAALRRSLENIGSRGFDPSSGIAQQLMLDVNRGYDESRAQSQNELAYRQIMEQRSREQEKQALMQYLSQLPMAQATGDMNFLGLLNSMIANASQNATATGGLLADLPVQRTQLGAQILGLGGQPQSSVPNLMALLNQAQQQKYMNQQGLQNYFGNIGYSFGF